MRNLGVEYLRVVFMTLIVLLHTMQYGYHEAEIIASHDMNSYIQLPIIMLGKLGVPGFVFITGYYGVRFKVDRIVNLWIQTTFYSLLSFFLLIFLKDSFFSFSSFINCFVSLFDGCWWFISDYFYLILLSVFLNEGIKKANEKTYTTIISLIIFTIYGVMWMHGRYSAMSLILFISMYIIGRYVALYPIKWVDKYKWQIFTVSLILLIILPDFAHATYRDKWILKYIITYFNIFTLTCIVSLFHICKNHKKRGEGNWLTKNVLAVYLIHCSPYGFDLLFNQIFANLEFNIIYIIAIVIILFIISTLIEEIRNRLFCSLAKKLAYKIESFVY